MDTTVKLKLSDGIIELQAWKAEAIQKNFKDLSQLKVIDALTFLTKKTQAEYL